MSEAFILCLVAIFGLAALGAPIAHSIIVGAITFLAVNGQDLALAAEQIIQGLYESFVLLAVPLFIVAANIIVALARNRSGGCLRLHPSFGLHTRGAGRGARFL